METIICGCGETFTVSDEDRRAMLDHLLYDHGGELVNVELVIGTELPTDPSELAQLSDELVSQ